MSTNVSVLTRPSTAINSPDFDICDRRYGTNLDIPRCDVAAGRLDFGSTIMTYQVSERRSPHTLPRRLEYGGCAITVEVAGPHLPVAYEVIPDAIHSLASHLINECVGRAGREGGFGTMEIGKLIDFVIDPSKDLAEYPPSSSFLTVSVTSTDLKDPSPGNYDPLIADTLAGAARDAAMSVPASGAARKTLVQRATAFRARAMRMSAGGSAFAWWGGNGGIRWRLE